jgi:hypothetical protein
VTSFRSLHLPAATSCATLSVLYLLWHARTLVTRAVFVLQPLAMRDGRSRGCAATQTENRLGQMQGRVLVAMVTSSACTSSPAVCLVRHICSVRTLSPFTALASALQQGLFSLGMNVILRHRPYS